MQQSLTVAFLLTLLLAAPQYLGQGTYAFLCQNETQIQGKPTVEAGAQTDLHPKIM